MSSGTALAAVADVKIIIKGAWRYLRKASLDELSTGLKVRAFVGEVCLILYGPELLLLQLISARLHDFPSQIDFNLPVEVCTNQRRLPLPLRLLELIPAAATRISAGRLLVAGAQVLASSIVIPIPNGGEAPCAESTWASFALESKIAIKVQIRESALAARAQERENLVDNMRVSF